MRETVMGEDARKQILEFFDAMKKRVMEQELVGATWSIKNNAGYDGRGRWVINGFSVDFQLVHPPIIVGEEQ